MYWHLTFAAEDRLALFSSEAKRLDAARTIARVGSGSLLLFCAADDHAHVVVCADRDRAGRLAANLSVALRRIAGRPLDRARIRPVKDRAHLRSLVGYVLDQSTHHGLQTATHPALWPGSSFGDLVGARLLPGFEPKSLTEALPRLTVDDLFAAVRLTRVSPAPDAVLAGLGIDFVARATAGVLGQEALSPGRANDGRATVARLGLGLGVASGRIAGALGASERHVRRLAKRPADPAIEAALRMSIAISRAATAG